MADMLLVWGGVMEALYTVGIAHLGAQLSDRNLASANTALIFYYDLGMILGPQVIGIVMDVFGSNGFGLALAVFFGSYIAIGLGRIATKSSR